MKEHTPLPKAHWHVFGAYMSLTYTYITGAFIDLYRDGGARPQGVQNNIEYSGPLELLPKLWLAITFGLLLVNFVQARFCLKRSTIRSPILQLIVLACISTAWAPYKTTTLFNALQLLGLYLITWVYISKFGQVKIITHFIGYARFVLVASIVYALAIPTYGQSVNVDSLGAWQGVFFHKNLLGGFLLISLIAEIYLFQLNSNKTHLWFLLAYIVIIWQSKSSTAIVCTACFIALIVTVGLFRSWTKYIYAMIFTAQLISSTLVLVLSVYSTSKELPLLGKDSTFSGRDAIWEYVLEEAVRSPIIGNGFSAFSATNSFDGTSFELAIGYITSTPHNGYLELFHSLGGLGIILFIFSVVMYLRRYQYGPTVPLAFLSVFLLANNFETRLIGFNIYFWMFILFYRAFNIKSKFNGKPSI